MTATAKETVANEELNLDAEIAALMGSDEIVEPSDAEIEAELSKELEAELAGGETTEVPSEDDLEAAISDVVAQLEAGTVVPEVAPVAKVEKPKKTRNSKKAKAADTEATDKPEASAVAETATEAPAEKKAKEYVPRYTNSTKSTVLQYRLGEKAQDYLILEDSDALLDEDGLKAKNAAVLKSIDDCTQKKVQEKAVMLFTWVKNGGKLNEVMARTMKVLARDGYITTGDKGNLHAELLSKPYSVGTARAQSGQMVTMLPMLHIAEKQQRGKLVANPHSMILAKAIAELGLDSKGLAA